MIAIFLYISGSVRSVCTNCGKTFSRSYNLNRHKRYECGKQPQFQCPQCPAKAKRKDNIIKHFISVHKPVFDRF